MTDVKDTSVEAGDNDRVDQCQLRKVTKARGHYPTDDAVVKLLWLAIINIEDKRAREHAARRTPRPASAQTSAPASSKASASWAGARP